MARMHDYLLWMTIAYSNGMNCICVQTIVCPGCEVYTCVLCEHVGVLCVLLEETDGLCRKLYAVKNKNERKGDSYVLMSCENLQCTISLADPA